MANKIKNPVIPGFASTTHRKVIGCAPWEREEIVLRIQMDGEKFTFSYGNSEEDMAELCIADGSENFADFDWFEMKQGE